MNRAVHRATEALLAIAVATALAASSTACEEKKSASDTAKSDAGVGPDKYATADPKLAKALQAAASASAGATDGPPPDGIFAPGLADQRHAKGVPTKVDVLTDGSDPKVSLGGAADGSPDAARATSYGLAALEVVQQMGRSAAPTIDFGLQLGPAKAEDGGPDVLVAAVRSATLAKEQPGQVPPGLDKDIASMAGSEIHLKLTSDGKESDVSMVMGKSSKPDFDRLTQNAADALVLATVPLPGKPVGVGAQWIAETRMPLSGLDVIAYRAFRVKSIDHDRLHLTVDVKAYATDKDTQLAGVPKGATFEQFDAAAQGEMEVVRGEILARKSDIQQRVVMVFAPPGGVDKPQPGQPPQQQMMTAQIVSQATLVRGDDLRQALKHP
jgi:hypothetical protein